MQLSKYYEDKNSIMRKVWDLLKRRSRKGLDLHELLRDTTEDFEVYDGVFKEKHVHMG